MDPSDAWLIPLREVAGLGTGLIGGKAQRLAQLTKAGFRTPEGFCITTEAYHRFLERNHLAPVIQVELGRKHVTVTAKKVPKTPAAIQKTWTDKMIENLDWIHRRG